MDSALSRDRVLITGGAVRIGRAIARRFAAAGATVVVHCHRSRDAAVELVHELETIHAAPHAVVHGDLTDPGDRRRVLEQAGPLTGLVNNASVYRRRPLLECDEEALLQDFGINFVAPFLLMREFAARPGPGARGFVINLLDQRVSHVDPAAGTYALAKKCLRDATEAAALEWAPRIRVNGVAPGFCLPPPGVAPAAMAPLLSQIPMETASDPTEVAEACLFLALSPTVTGQVLYVDGGLHLGSASAPESRTHADYGQ
jgi:NAD(P)-dependent dehydrogenase (short-subunit alcohol dehydrogenase family)